MAETHGESAGHEAEAPPGVSVWPIFTGISVLILGIVLAWWFNTDQDKITQPLLGASVVVVVLCLGAWFVEYIRRERASKRRGLGEARRTQVVTFSISEGKLDEARAGILAEIESTDNRLRELPGFEDLRVNLAPAETGPSQAIVETTWSDTERLASYEETRQTILDMIAQHPDVVVSGTVQVFDMQVVRDTKQVVTRMGATMASVLLSAFIVGGFAVGAGISLFVEEETTVVPGNGGNGNGEPGFDGVIVARDILFDITEFKLPPGVDVTLVMDNQDPDIPHNIALYNSPTAGEGGFLEGCTDGCMGDGTAIRTEIENGIVQQTFTFTTPGPGTYGFLCEVHPTTMVGVMVIEEGAPLPGETGDRDGNGDGGDGDGAITIVGKDNAFQPTAFTVTSGEEVTLVMDNQDENIPHNFHFFTTDTPGEGDTLEGCIEGCADGGTALQTPLDAGPTLQTVKFTAPAPGQYGFWCDVHPTTMFGVMTVE